MPSPASDPLDLDAVRLLALVRTRKLSAAELMAATLDRIAGLNPTFNAIIALRDRESLMAEARRKDADADEGALFGLPLAIKDLSAAKGLPMTMGSPLLKDFVADADSIFVERLRGAGAILIGKTNTPEFGLGSQTYNPLHGATRNAYHPALTSTEAHSPRRSTTTRAAFASPGPPTGTEPFPASPGCSGSASGALKVFESIGCVVEPAVPEFSLDALWDAWVRLRHWQVGANLAPFWTTRPCARK